MFGMGRIIVKEVGSNGIIVWRLGSARTTNRDEREQLIKRCNCPGGDSDAFQVSGFQVMRCGQYPPPPYPPSPPP